VSEKKVRALLASRFIDVLGEQGDDAVALVSVYLFWFLLGFQSSSSRLHRLRPSYISLDCEPAIVVADLLKACKELCLGHKLGFCNLVHLLLFFIVDIRDRWHIEAHVLWHLWLLKDDRRLLSNFLLVRDQDPS
jgi:hypothetical protein